MRNQVELSTSYMDRSTDGGGESAAIDLVRFSSGSDLLLRFGHSLPASAISSLGIPSRGQGSAGGDDTHETRKFPVSPLGALVLLVVGATAAIRNGARGPDWLFFCGWGASVLGVAGLLDVILRWL